MRKSAVILAAITAALMTFTAPAHSSVSTEAKPVKKAPRASAKQPPRTVFDMGHNEIFSPLNKGDLHYSTLTELIRNTGEEVTVNKRRIDATSLEGARTYILAGPMQAVDPAEVEALSAFVKKGGNLLLLLHISPPVAGLTLPFGVVVSNYVICEKADTINNASQDFNVTRLAPHPVTEGIKKISVFGSWGLATDADNAKIIASTSNGAWMDLNRNRTWEKDEPVESYGIIAASTLGKGKVVVIADDAPFSNRFIGAADNRRLAENILRWFRE